jgi:dipeptidyl aminopeptidase/acylaminoacyl peptidase
MRTLALIPLIAAVLMHSPSAATQTLPYGSWPSRISAASIEEGARGMHSLSVDGEYLYWVESRPEEGGRSTIMRWHEESGHEELLPAPWNVRSRVHEYGGRSYLVADGVIWFTQFDDQRLYRFMTGEEPVAITPEAGLRYAACVHDAPRQRLICVREDHRGEGEPRNALVAVPMSGVNEGKVLFEDSDFVAAASLSPDGRRIAFVAWEHPNMPWDDTTLWYGSFDAQGALTGLEALGEGESLIDPQWDRRNRLHVISDRSNWWSLYRVQDDSLVPVPHGLDSVELGGPAWTLGGHYYHFTDDDRIVARITARGQEQLHVMPAAGGSARRLPLESAAVGSVALHGHRLFTVNYTTARPAELITVDLDGASSSVLRRSQDTAPDPGWIPAYRAVTFPTGGAVAHGFYYPPTHPSASGPAGSRPPLIVTVHGGPTSAASPVYSPSRLYWTSRGFAVLDLNYRGSTGFGRAYRRALYGEWGVADVEDALAGARWAAAEGLADPRRLIIRGGSAGGYTTLAAHAFGDTFAAGASYYGISDIEALARDTHKFESRYLDQLIGPYPEARALYRERSPIHHLDGFSAPLLLLQGLDDRVVPPNQSEMIFAALKERGIRTAYIAFEGEGHGFRNAENAIRARESELYFYGRVLGFTPADELPAIDIVGLD